MGDGAGYRLSTTAPTVAEVRITDVPTWSISGVVWQDDGDGIRQDTEQLLADETVTLLDESGVVLYSTQTNTQGGYTFTGLDYSQGYYVQFASGEGDTFSPENVGSSNRDSDADALSGTTALLWSGGGRDSSISTPV